MSDGAISQDEIDALLSGVAIDGLNSSGHVGNGPVFHFDIKALQQLADDLRPKLEENINKKVLGRLGLNEQLVFRFLFEDNEVRKKQKSDRILNEYNADLLILNEAREMLGYPLLESEYGNMLKSEFKNALNIEYAKETNVDNGGFNGVGKNRYGGEKTE